MDTSEVRHLLRKGKSSGLTELEQHFLNAWSWNHNYDQSPIIQEMRWEAFKLLDTLRG